MLLDSEAFTQGFLDSEEFSGTDENVMGQSDFNDMQQDIVDEAQAQTNSDKDRKKLKLFKAKQKE